MLQATRPPSRAAALSRIAELVRDRLGVGGSLNRGDLPSVWLLRVAERAYDDLGIDPRERSDIEALKRAHPILRRFFDDLAVEANVDTGTPIQKVRNPKVFRIREQDERAAVWYDSTHGVVWCCRVLAIADFPNEPKLYEHFGRLEGDTNKRPPWPSVLLPSDQERREAGGQQRLESIIVALAAARDTAFASPRTWCPGFIRRPDGEDEQVGRVFVDRDIIDEAGELVTRFILVIDHWPADLPRPADWRARIIAFCFADDEPVMPAFNALPAGTHLARGEVPLVQRRLEGSA